MFEINKTVWDIESREPWPYLEKTVALNTDGASPAPTNMPADFKSVLWLYDITNGITIWPEKLQTVRDRHGQEITQVSSPSLYYFVGSQLRMWPVPPAATGRFQLDYIATQPILIATSVETDILLPVRHHEAIVLGTLWRLYKGEDDPENGMMFQQDYETKIAQMRDDLFRRQWQRSDHIYVTDEDDEFMY